MSATSPPAKRLVSLSTLIESTSSNDLSNGLKPPNWRRIYLSALDNHITPDNTASTPTATATTIDIVQLFPFSDLQPVAALLLRSLRDPNAVSPDVFWVLKRSPKPTLNSGTIYY